jgi:hypothetical protein
MNAQRTLTALAAACALFSAASAQASIVTYRGVFVPEAVGATGSGNLQLIYDNIARTLAISADWTGLSGNTTTAHIHCCNVLPNTGTSGVALAQGSILPDFPLGVKSGSYSRLIDLSQSNQYGAAFFSASGSTTLGAEQRLMTNLGTGNAYFNIHTTTFGPGEIRAFVKAVPEPGSLALVLAAAGLAALTVGKRKSA